MSAMAPNNPSGQDLPILIVDDDEPTRKLLQALLVRYGFQTEIASNGREAIEFIQSRDYAVVVLDLMMPTASGQDVVDFLSGYPRRVPVVVCTAAGVAKSMVFDTNVVKAVIRKPFDIDQFIEVVKGLTAVHPTH
jgi:CheY-like chemotaxis protein